jgi:hypothetical protein
MNPRTPVRPVFLLINAAFIVALLVIGAIAAWPIYETPFFIVTVAGAAILAAGISLLGLWLGLSPFTIVLVTIGAYLLLGVPLAMPSAFADLGSIGASWLQFVSATVFGWKQIVTVAIPVGTYQALLVPAFFIVLFGTTAAFSLAWRTQRLQILAVPAAAALAFLGLAFGSPRESDELRVLWMQLAPKEVALGLATLLVALAFLLWRATDARHHALRSGAAAVVRQQRGSAAGAVRRWALAIVMLLIAVTVAATVLPTAAVNERQVLRTAVEPPITLSEYVSPLSQYRAYFAGELYNETLFEVSGDIDDGTRLRLAVLGYYDGEVYRVVNPVTGATSRETAFERIPSRLHPDGSIDEFEVEVGEYEGVWLPTVGSLASIDFSGSNASALIEGFYYNAGNQAGVQLRLLGPGDSYVLEVVQPDEVDLATLRERTSRAGLIDEGLIPESLIEWVRLQRVGTDGAALLELVERLRARGYLSHSLMEPEGADADWMADLGGDYAFESSLAGHSIDRIDALFASLVQKQREARSTDDIDLVAAVGDDEQFAVAVALVAQYLGFDSRVVLGFDLGGSDSVASCDSGTCAGGDLIAWVEVQGRDDAWATIDVTPQHENPVSPLDNNLRDPENLTEVVPDIAQEQLPPEAAPSGGDQEDVPSEQVGPDLSWLRDVLKVVGVSLLSLLVILMPFLTVLVAKARRRRQRMKDPEPENRIVGGWDEYVDAALDHGRPLPSSETRTEIAQLYGTPRAMILATLADEAVFHAEPPEADTSARFWAIVEAEKRALAAGMTRWQRLRAAVSLRSFTRYLTTELPHTKR